ncbi:MAG: MgtC/SapB family protein [Faecousia sp.]
MFELRELTLLSVFVRILTAIVLGGAIGMERGMKNRPAGLRTYMLVCIGACIVMITNQYAVQVFGVGDPVRMAAQVVSGIGFLGAGTIIVTSRNRIKGLTTAAGLWASACVGLAIGIGFYEVALIGAVSIFVILTLLHMWDRYMRSHMRVIELYIELEQAVSLGEFLQAAREAELTVTNLQLERETNPNGACLSFLATFGGRKGMTHEDLTACVRSLPCVHISETLS